MVKHMQAMLYHGVGAAVEAILAGDVVCCGLILTLEYFTEPFDAVLE